MAIGLDSCQVRRDATTCFLSMGSDAGRQQLGRRHAKLGASPRQNLGGNVSNNLARQRMALTELGRHASQENRRLSMTDGIGQRRDRQRSRTIPMRRLTRAEIQEGKELAAEVEYLRPQTRSECANGIRPCPYVSCKHHLYLDVNPVTGSIKVNFPDLEVWEMADTCALDIADRGGITLEEVGSIMNLTRERIRQVEVSGLEKLQAQDFAVDLETVFRS